MHVHFLDPYRAGSSPIHALDPRIKLVLALALILTTTLTPVGAWPAYILLFALVLSVEILSELGVGKVLKRSSLALPFVLAALPLAFSFGTHKLFAVALGFGELTVFAEGLERFASIAVRSWISVQVAIVLASTTPFPDLMLAMRAIRVPRLLVSIFGLMWRYIFVMADEAGRLMRARESRSAVAAVPGLKSGGSIGWRARVTGGMAGNLFVRSLERGDRIYSAMSARGYDGEVRTLGLPRVSPGEWALLAVGIFVLMGLLWLSYLLS